MRTTRHGLFQFLLWSAILAAGLAVSVPAVPAVAQSKGGGKPKPPPPPPPPPPNIPRPLCFSGQTGNNQYGLLRSDLGGESVTSVNTGIDGSSWPRWSPDGSMIGCYHKFVNSDWALMVMNRDATGEKVVLTGGQFNAWNLSRPGVIKSIYHPTVSFVHNCWLGNNAFAFTARTIYDASFFGGQPGTQVAYTHLFIVDAEGTITALTETTGLLVASSPHWSPALDKIVFVGMQPRAAWQQLFAINPDGTGLTQITNFGSALRPQHAVWSPAGDRLALTTNNDWNLILLDVDLSQPNSGSGEGGRVTAVLPFKTAPSTRNYTPSWSPNGRFIAYDHLQMTDDPGGYAFGDYILIADVETGAETIVTGPKSDVKGPDWDPLDFVP